MFPGAPKTCSLAIGLSVSGVISIVFRSQSSQSAEVINSGSPLLSSWGVKIQDKLGVARVRLADPNGPRQVKMDQNDYVGQNGPVLNIFVQHIFPQYLSHSLLKPSCDGVGQWRYAIVQRARK